MSIFCNYNIPIFPMTFGALTMGAGGCSVPIGGYSYNPFMSSGLMCNYTQPLFNFNNTFSNNSTIYNDSSWTMPWSGWFNNFSFNFNTPQLSMPKLDFSGFNFNFNNNSYSSSSIGDTFTRSSTNITSLNKHGGKIIPEGYNSNKGLKLANAALKESKGRTSGTGWCSKSVRMAMQSTGTYTSHPEHAADFIPILDKNPHFKKLTISNINVQDLPAGCVLVYGRGVGGYSSDSGHIEITTGDGRAASDFVHIATKKPTAIYIPV